MTRTTTLAAAAVALISAGLLAACAASGMGDAPADAEDLARGGRLYDNWINETGADTPDASHPLYPATGKYAEKPGANWRCKECHGWDYLGRDGAYAAGKHHSGIAGVAAYAGTDPAAIVATLKGDDHGYAGKMSDDDLHRVALFVSRGQVAMDAVIDREAKSARGNATRGSAYYATLCAGCHGAEGIATDMPTLGPLARKNPWETLHKILNGQPASAMPALRSLDHQVALDVLKHVESLPDGAK